MTCGPNAVIGAGSLLAIMEKQVDYIVEVGRKMQRECVKTLEPREEATREWDEYLEAYFKTVSGGGGGDERMR